MMNTELNELTSALLKGDATWDLWLTKLAETLELRTIHIATINTETYSFRWQVHGGVKMPPQDIEHFISVLAPQDWGVQTAINSKSMMIKSLFTEGILEQATNSDFGQHYAKPRDIRDVLAVKIHEDEPWSTIILANSNYAQGPINHQKIEQFSEYLKLIIELATWQSAKDYANKTEYLEAILNLQKIPSAIYDTEGVLISSDSAFNTRLHTLGIIENIGDIESWHDQEQLRLYYLSIMEASRVKAAKITHNMGTYTHAETGTNFLLTTLFNNELMPVGVLVNFVQRPKNPKLPEDAAHIFKLTHTEVQICNCLLAGKSAKEISFETSKSIYTVRDQIKSILKKTDCNNQVQLLTLISSLPISVTD